MGDAKMRVAGFFSGAGGLDLGFEKAGFDVVWANEFDRMIWDTYRRNHPNTVLDGRSITAVAPEDVAGGDPIDGMIGGPPCQSWSIAGERRGLDDPRGRLFHDYVRLVSALRPKFFLAENVKGLVRGKFEPVFEQIKSMFAAAGYDVSARLLNAVNYEVPQDRERVIIVGIRSDLGLGPFAFPDPVTGSEPSQPSLLGQDVRPVLTLRDAIGDLPDSTPAMPRQRRNDGLAIPNHEHLTEGFSPIYMQRDRRRPWDRPSFTIQAGGRQAPIHPGCPPMEFVRRDEWRFVPPVERYRRLSVRECARIQTFPDDFEFLYERLEYGYKMIGNAVPVRLAYHMASAIRRFLER